MRKYRLMIRSTRVNKASKCPVCREVLDGATDFFKAHVPEPGAVSVCGYCGQLLIFAEDLTVRIPTALELREIQASQTWPLLKRMIATVYRLKALRGAQEN